VEKDSYPHMETQQKGLEAKLVKLDKFKGRCEGEQDMKGGKAY